MTLEVRTAGPADAPALVTLIQAMRYDVSAGAVRQRLLELPPDHAVFVAIHDDQVRGWCHVYHSHSLIAGPRAEIAGLAVDATSQGSGIGTALLRHTEQWARQRGIDVVHLRSGTERTAAHDFYRRNGYRTLKTQLALSKTLRALDPGS